MDEYKDFVIDRFTNEMSTFTENLREKDLELSAIDWTHYFSQWADIEDFYDLNVYFDIIEYAKKEY